MPQSPDSEAAPAARSAIPSDPKQYRKFVQHLALRAEHLETTGRRLLDRHGTKLTPAVQQSLAADFSNLHKARTAEGKQRSTAALLEAVEIFDTSLDEHLGRYRKSVFREYVEAIFWAVMLTLVIRAFVFEAFKIPTGSMIPTLLVNDHLFVNKFLYGLKIPFTRIKFLTMRIPRPGEVIVFEYPYDDDPESTGKDLIKRVVGAPGDRVRMVGNVLQINGKPVPRHIVSTDADCSPTGSSGRRCVVARECLGGVVYTTQHHVPPPPHHFSMDVTPDWPPPDFDERRFGPHAALYSLPENKAFPDYVVPAGHLLVMGDNRDNSKDGRFFGLVPLDTVKGKAGILWWAYDEDWYAPQLDRIGSFVHEDRPEGTCEGF